MIELFFDGACTPKNPGGTATWAYLIKRNGVKIRSDYGVVGTGKTMTNNIAEYEALVHGLRALHALNNEENLIVGDVKIKVYGDSQLVVKMVNKEWGWLAGQWIGHSGKAHHLHILLEEAIELITKIGATISWIPRTQNQEADYLSKVAFTTVKQAQHGFIKIPKKIKTCVNCAGSIDIYSGYVHACFIKADTNTENIGDICAECWRKMSPEF